MTVVYYVLDGDDLLISTMAARAKAEAVRRNPKVSLCILDEQWPLTYLQVYGDATLEEDFDQAVDVLRRVIDLMAGEDVSSAKRPEIERMAREENRVVIRVRPYATFATPPRHVYKAKDIDTLTHFTSSSTQMADPGQDWPGIFEEMLGAPVVLRSYGPTSAGMRGYQRHGPASFGQRRVLPDADGRAGRCLVDKLPDPAHAVDGRLGLDGPARPPLG